MKKKDHTELNSIPKENPFRVPENYFDSFPERMKGRIKEEESRDTRQKPGRIFRMVTGQMALAASLVTFVIISYFSVRIILDRHENMGGTYTYSDIIEYGLEEYELETIIDAYSEDVTSTGEDDYDQEIIDYLVTENIDMNLIISEL